ncbi:MAG: hypothetical protein ACFE68_09935 [Candidatus Hodarchaeota archaeon]
MTFVIGIFSTSVVNTQGETNNIWGVETGDELTYTVKDELQGTASAEDEYIYNFDILRVEDWLYNGSPGEDNITDLTWILKIKSDNVLYVEMKVWVSGIYPFDEDSLTLEVRTGLSILMFFVPIDYVPTDPPTQIVDGGLNWTAAEEAINTAQESDYFTDFNMTTDGDNVKIVTTDDRDHLHVNGTDFFYYADYDQDMEFEWDKSTGLLQKAIITKTYNESLGLVEKTTITKGEKGILDSLSDNAIPIAALGLAFLALLIVIIKK